MQGHPNQSRHITIFTTKCLLDANNECYLDANSENPDKNSNCHSEDSSVPPWWSSWIADRNDFNYFLSTSRPNASYQVSSGLSLQEKKWKIDFQDGSYI